MKSGRKIRVLLADDHLVVRIGLSDILSFEPDIEVVGEASDGAEAVRKAMALKPDVVVMDLMMPKLDGAAATEQIRAVNPATRILVLTTFGGSEEMRRALAVGAAGALVKGASKPELLGAIRRLASGGTVISPEIARSLELQPAAALSDRQLEVLGLAAKGLSNREIAGLLGVSLDCVKEHLKLVFSRLDATTRTEAVAIAVARGLIRL
ncbi:MAG: response regulator [Kiritimatiellia bacterium]